MPSEREKAGPVACEPVALVALPPVPRLPGGAPDRLAGRLPAPEGAPRLLRFPDDVPLHMLLLAAARLMGAYGESTVRKAGLKVSLSGLGVLRVLVAEDGLKATEVAERAWSNPGTLTAVVSTLVRDGFAERRPDEADRRVVRLYITEPGRAVVTYYVAQAAPLWRKAFDFVNAGDEAVIRRFLTDMIGHFGQLIDEERGK